MSKEFKVGQILQTKSNYDNELIKCKIIGFRNTNNHWICDFSLGEKYKEFTAHPMSSNDLERYDILIDPVVSEVRIPVIGDVYKSHASGRTYRLECRNNNLAGWDAIDLADNKLYKFALADTNFANDRMEFLYNINSKASGSRYKSLSPEKLKNLSVWVDDSRTVSVGQRWKHITQNHTNEIIQIVSAREIFVNTRTECDIIKNNRISAHDFKYYTLVTEENKNAPETSLPKRPFNQDYIDLMDKLCKEENVIPIKSKVACRHGDKCKICSPKSEPYVCNVSELDLLPDV